MTRFKRALVTVIGIGSLVVPLGLGGVAHAQSDNFVGQADLTDQGTSTLVCNNPDSEVTDPTTEGCDLAIDKQVSVNGGAFVEADTSADAAQAQVGDTVTWQITVTNTSDGSLVPQGILTVADQLPSGVSFDSYTASTGIYGSGIWTFDLSGSLPATLTITSHATATGLFQNIASLSVLDSCSNGCVGPYADSNPDNNSDDAWVDPSAKPAVLAESTTLANTGGGTVPSIIAGGLVVTTLATAFVGRKRLYKVDR